MKILLIEDDRLISGVLRDELIDAGYEVVQAFDGEEGLLKTEIEKPSIVLLDLMMPKKGGIEVLKEMKASDKMKDIPVIVLTASENEFKLGEAFEIGAMDAMLKSRHTMEGIIDRIKKIS